MELFEVLEQLREIKAEKDQSKKQKSIIDLIDEIEEDLLSDGICIKCGCNLEERERYHYEHGYREVDEYWRECESCGEKYDY